MKLKLKSSENISITLDEVKQYLRIVTNEEDSLLTTLLLASTQKAEAIINRALSIKTYELYLDKLQTFELPKPPFRTLNSIQVLQNNEYIDFNAYKLDDKDTLAKIIINEISECEDINCLKVEFECGYEILPNDIKIWILATISTLYENREQISDVNSYELPNRFIDSLLDKYKVRYFV